MTVVLVVFRFVFIAHCFSGSTKFANTTVTSLLAKQSVASDSESQRARDPCQSTAMTPPVNLSFPSLPRVSRHLIDFVPNSYLTQRDSQPWPFSDWLTIWLTDNFMPSSLQKFRLFTRLITNSTCDTSVAVRLFQM